MEKSSRIDSVDILRGLMALSVATYHLAHWSKFHDDTSRISNVLAILGNYGVEGFFVVSGFCFFHLYGKTRWSRQAIVSFHIKRFFRIAPLYYLAIILNLALGLHVGPLKFSWRFFMENMTLSFGFFHPNHAMVLGGWSIGIEYVFYAVFPVLAFLTRSRVALLVLLLTSLAFAIPSIFGAVQNAVYDEKFHVYVQIRNHAFLFLFGALIAQLRNLTSFRFTTIRFVALLLLILIVFFPRGPLFMVHFDIMAGLSRVKYVLLCFGIVALFAFYEVPDRAWRIPFVFLGNVSYSVYLLHPFAYRAVNALWPASGPSGLKFITALGVTLGFAALVYQLLERPAIRLGRRLAHN